MSTFRFCTKSKKKIFVEGGAKGEKAYLPPERSCSEVKDFKQINLQLNTQEQGKRSI